ncbi:MAG: UDP-N-acetylglucosamine 2-epimerase (non-hydrolyzing) [Balneolales bacterium]
MIIDIIAGVRPNFIKIAPIIQEIKKAKNYYLDISYRLIHTGQHYDKNMSGSFFEQLEIPKPDVNLNAGGGTQAEQTAAIMIGFEKELNKNPADLVLVVGDVTSTLACSIVAKKLNTKVAHVEGGIRSDDLSMPEEINRLVTDSITDYFFTTSEIANENLRKAGVAHEQIHFVGNTMIDTLLANMDRLKQPGVWNELNLKKGDYSVMTLHRPGNVDEEGKLRELIDEIVNNSQGLPLVFPVHPRTKKILETLGIAAPNLYMIDPLGYLEFNYLVKHAKAVITDSGGITEETTVMGVPCLTLRDNTERPETITMGTNELVGTDPQNIAPYLKRLFAGEWKQGGIPEKWDGRAAERIVQVLLDLDRKASKEVTSS